MKITQDVRDYADAMGVAPERALDQSTRDQGMKEKAAEFKERGGKLYVPAAEAGGGGE
jgi:phosphomethylpyrimidine synthase